NIAPEVIRGKKNTKESDVYNVGMLMWEIFVGHPPFDDRAHNHCLIFDICEKGLQPPILPNMPEDYVQMMQKCWDVDPSKRPTIGELFFFANKKLNEVNNNGSGSNRNDSNIDSSSGSRSDLSQVHE